LKTAVIIPSMDTPVARSSGLTRMTAGATVSGPGVLPVGLAGLEGLLAGGLEAGAGVEAPVILGPVVGLVTAGGWDTAQAQANCDAIVISSKRAIASCVAVLFILIKLPHLDTNQSCPFSTLIIIAIPWPCQYIYLTVNQGRAVAEAIMTSCI
jgi:hypothetical protein